MTQDVDGIGIELGNVQPALVPSAERPTLTLAALNPESWSCTVAWLV